MRPLNLVGIKFGKLTVIKLHHVKKGRYWLCQCECGNKTIQYVGQLRTGRTKSCGCLKVEQAIKTNTTHGMAYTRFYSIWAKMLRRIRDKNCQDFKFYGGRGIGVCNEWNNFQNFMEDMFASYEIACKKFGERSVSIERINVNRDYCPQNCCWIHVLEQSKNRRNTIWVRFKDKNMCLKDFSNVIHKNYYYIYKLYKNGKLWSLFGEVTHVNHKL